jgi:hypothetical protein
MIPPHAEAHYRFHVFLRKFGVIADAAPLKPAAVM